MRIFAAACREHKIIVVGDSVARIGAAAMAIAALLWPMVWQGVFVPLLPDHMCEFLQSPVPFILGVRAEAYEAAEAMELVPDDAVVARLDRHAVQVPPQQSSRGSPTWAVPNQGPLLSALEAFRARPGHGSGGWRPGGTYGDADDEYCDSEDASLTLALTLALALALTR